MDHLKRHHDVLKIKELVESSFQTRFEEGRGLREASAAVLLAEKDPTVPGDLRVAAWTQFGNALRFCGKFREAEASLAKASALLTVDSDPRTRANLLEIRASLHRARGRFAESEACLIEAIEIHKGLRDTQAEARDFVLLGLVDYDAHLYSRSANSFQSSLTLLNEESDTRLYVSACHGLIATLWAAGRLQAAAAAFKVAEPVFRSVSERPLIGRIKWLQARISLALEDKAGAAEAFAAARDCLDELSESDREVFEAEMAAVQS